MESSYTCWILSLDNPTKADIKMLESFNTPIHSIWYYVFCIAYDIKCQNLPVKESELVDFDFKKSDVFKKLNKQKLEIYISMFSNEKKELINESLKFIIGSNYTYINWYLELGYSNLSILQYVNSVQNYYVLVSEIEIKYFFPEFLKYTTIVNEFLSKLDIKTDETNISKILHIKFDTIIDEKKIDEENLLINGCGKLLNEFCIVSPRISPRIFDDLGNVIEYIRSSKNDIDKLIYFEKIITSTKCGIFGSLDNTEIHNFKDLVKDIFNECDYKFIEKFKDIIEKYYSDVHIHLCFLINSLFKIDVILDDTINSNLIEELNKTVFDSENMYINSSFGDIMSILQKNFIDIDVNDIKSLENLNDRCKSIKKNIF